MGVVRFLFFRGFLLVLAGLLVCLGGGLAAGLAFDGVRTLS